MALLLFGTVMLSLSKDGHTASANDGFNPDANGNVNSIAGLRNRWVTP